MKNHEIMNIKLTRQEVLDLRVGIRHIIRELNKDILDDSTSIVRKDICQREIDYKWLPILEKIGNQFFEQD